MPKVIKCFTTQSFSQSCKIASDPSRPITRLIMKRKYQKILKYTVAVHPKQDSNCKLHSSKAKRQSKLTHLSICITNQDHFMQHFAIRCILWNNFPKHEQHFLQSMILQWHHKSYDYHQQRLHFLSIQHHLNNFF